MVPCLLLFVGILLGVFLVQGHRCAYRAQKQDPEELLDEQTLMSPDKCLKELIYDMSTSGSGSGKSKKKQQDMTAKLDLRGVNLKYSDVLMVLLLEVFKNVFACRAPSAGAADHSPDHCPAGDHREGSVWGGVARKVARGRRGCQDLLLQG